MTNCHPQNENETWVRLGASHLKFPDSGILSQEESEITNSRLDSFNTALPVVINNIKTERNKNAALGMACARFGSTYTEIGTLHRRLKKPQR